MKSSQLRLVGIAAGVGTLGGLLLGALLYRASWPHVVIPLEVAVWGLVVGLVAGLVFLWVRQRVQAPSSDASGTPVARWHRRDATLVWALAVAVAGAAGLMAAAALAWRAAHDAGVLDVFLDWQVVNPRRQALVLGADQVRHVASIFGICLGALVLCRGGAALRLRRLLVAAALASVLAASALAALPLWRVMQPANHSCATDVDGVLSLMRKVADWQLARPRHRPSDWHNCPWHAGLLALHRAGGDPRFRETVRDTGEKLKWRLGPDARSPDDHCIGSIYLELYRDSRDPRLLQAVRERFNAIRESPEVGRPQWWWCDALFMAPPVLAMLAEATDRSEYLDLLDSLFWEAVDELYAPTEALFHRDRSFVGRREANGRGMFWGRGNAWVLAGLARTLAHMPAHRPARQRYVELFQRMAQAVAQAQQPDGFWRASLLDPAAYPGGESSGTALFAFALAWGINAGLLPEDRYRPVVGRAWHALCNAVSAQGRLGWVQREDIQPASPRPFDWDTYASGALLMAGAELVASERRVGKTR